MSQVIQSYEEDEFVTEKIWTRVIDPEGLVG